MAASAAQAYFDAQSPEDQAAIKESWGGRDLLEEWYKNAVDDGAVPGVKKGDYTTPTSGAAGAGGNWTPAQIRSHFQSQGFDTFDLIDDNTLNTWIKNGLWDQQSKRFKPERGSTDNKEIDYTRQPDFKPSDCPEGYTPNGSGANALCTPNSEFDPVTGAHRPGGGTGAASTTPAATGTGAQNLQSYLTALMQNRANIFQSDGGGGFAGQPLAGGGVMWSPLNQGNTRSNPGGNLGATMEGGAQTGGPDPKPTSETGAIASPYGGYNPAANTNSGNAALTSATLNAFSPTNAPSASSASPTAQAITPPATPTTPPPTQPFASPGGAQPGGSQPTNWATASGTANPLVAQVNRRYNPIQGQWWNQAR